MIHFNIVIIIHWTFEFIKFQLVFGNFEVIILNIFYFPIAKPSKFQDPTIYACTMTT